MGCWQRRSVFEWHVACTLHVAWDDRLARYDFGSWHPMAPVRVEMTMELARAFGVFPGMHDASALVAGATLAAARKVWAGEAWHGASIAGGLHHAMRASASGFCVYNDPAIAISWLLAAELGQDVAGPADDLAASARGARLASLRSLTVA